MADEIDLAALHAAETLEELVALIRRLPPNPDAIHPPKGSLADALAALIAIERDADFDLAAWEAEWRAVEEEMERMEREDEEREALLNRFGEGQEP